MNHQVRRRRTGRLAKWTLIISVSFVILSLTILEPLLARNSVQNHDSKFDLPQTDDRSKTQSNHPVGEDTHRYQSSEAGVAEATTSACAFCSTLNDPELVVAGTGGNTCRSIQLLAAKEVNGTDTCGVIQKEERVCCPGVPVTDNNTVTVRRQQNPRTRHATRNRPVPVPVLEQYDEQTGASQPEKEGSRWIEVSYKEGIARWKAYLSELFQIAQTLNATLVEPCMKSGAEGLGSCAGEKFKTPVSDLLFDLERYKTPSMGKEFPLLVSFDNYQAALRESDSDIPMVKLCRSKKARDARCSTNTTRIDRIGQNQLMDIMEQVNENNFIIQIEDYLNDTHPISSNSQRIGYSAKQFTRFMQYGTPRTASTLQFNMVCACFFLYMRVHEPSLDAPECFYQKNGNESLLDKPRVIKTHNTQFLNDFGAKSGTGVFITAGTKEDGRIMAKKLMKSGGSVALIQDFETLTEIKSEGFLDLYADFFDLPSHYLPMLHDYFTLWEKLRVCCGRQMSKYWRYELNNSTWHEKLDPHPFCGSLDIDAVEKAFINTTIFKMNRGLGISGALDGTYCSRYNKAVQSKGLKFNQELP